MQSQPTSLSRYLLYRALSAIVVVLGVCTLVFFLVRVVPGDPIEWMLGENFSLADRGRLRAEYGLDQPLISQWAHYMTSLGRLDLGYSIHEHEPVTTIILHRLPATLLLALSAMATALFIAVPLGIVASLKRRKALDTLATLLASIGISIPNFWLGPVLILLFAYYLGWLPISGMGDGGKSLVLPSITLGSALAALQMRVLRTALLEVLNENFICAARARGISKIRLLFFHALRNAVLPIMAVLGLQLAVLLGGTVITETVFDWPGLGLLIIESIEKRDYPVLQGCVLVISLIYVAVNLLIDLVYPLLDPRINLHS